MSANNWTQCPTCLVRNEKYLAELEKKASDAYGVASPEQFDELREHAKRFRKDMQTEDCFCATLREDWDLGIHESKFYVSYKSLCLTCGFKFEFKHEEKVEA